MGLKLDARNVVQIGINKGWLSVSIPPPEFGPSGWLKPSVVKSGTTGYRKPYSGPAWPADPAAFQKVWSALPRKERARIIQARARAERRGEDTSRFPARVRMRSGPPPGEGTGPTRRKQFLSVGASTKKLMTKSGHTDDTSNKGLLCAVRELDTRWKSAGRQSFGPRRSVALHKNGS
jgi:hypothetical protein